VPEDNTHLPGSVLVIALCSIGEKTPKRKKGKKQGKTGKNPCESAYKKERKENN
jgi:hypothetical protein